MRLDMVVICRRIQLPAIRRTSKAMDSSLQTSTTRREFFETAGKLAAVSALANVAIPPVHAAGTDLIQVALIVCVWRGGGAAANALSVKRGPTKLVAVADLFPERRTFSLL